MSKILFLLKQHKSEMMHRFNVRSLALFGSFARGEESALSDVDILVDFNGKGNSKNYYGLQFYLEDLLHRPVDLITLTALRPELKPFIEKDSIYV